MKIPMFPEIDILYINHLAVITVDFEQAVSDYLSLPQSRLIKGPNLNHQKHIKYIFIQIQDGLIVELLSPEEGFFPQDYINHGSGPYYFCYAVANISQAIQKAQLSGARLVDGPTADAAFDGRQVAFLVHPAHGSFEMVEAFPAGIQTAPFFLGPNHNSQLKANFTFSDTPEQILEERLKQVFLKIFPGIEISGIEQIQMDSVQAWTSLRHLQLMMEIEEEFEIEIPAQRLGYLISFSLILDELTEKVVLPP